MREFVRHPERVCHARVPEWVALSPGADRLEDRYSFVEQFAVDLVCVAVGSFAVRAEDGDVAVGEPEQKRKLIPALRLRHRLYRLDAFFKLVFVVPLLDLFFQVFHIFASRFVKNAFVVEPLGRQTQNAAHSRY